MGGPGSAKTIFATQFLMAGMKAGEKCLYITFEENKEQFYDNMLTFGWNLEEYEKKGLFTFLEYSPSKIKNMLEEGGGSVESTIVSKKIDRLVIDSITAFSLLFSNELEKRTASLFLFKLIKNWNCTSLLTLEADPLNEDKVYSRTFEFLSDSVTKFYFVLNKNKRERFLEIFKMRGTGHSKQIYGFDINNKGIIINPTSSSVEHKIR